jgi:hypothetical protein
MTLLRRLWTRVEAAAAAIDTAYPLVVMHVILVHLAEALEVAQKQQQCPNAHARA